MTKTCTKCLLEQDIANFGPQKAGKGGLNYWCRKCCAAYQQEYKQKNRDKVLCRRREYLQRPEIRARKQELERERSKRPDVKKKKLAEQRVRNRQRRKEDVVFRMSVNLRVRMWAAIKRGSRAGSAVRDLGCTIPKLKAYLESKFYPHPETGEAMTWENWTLDGWHIDHIRPLASFDLEDRQQFLVACHYTNLQPLWAKANLRKGAREAA